MHPVVEGLEERERGGWGLFFFFPPSEKWLITSNRFCFGNKIYREFGSVSQFIGNYREINKPHTFSLIVAVSAPSSQGTGLKPC